VAGGQPQRGEARIQPAGSGFEFAIDQRGVVHRVGVARPRRLACLLLIIDYFVNCST
jgi:hypothetical protein